MPLLLQDGQSLRKMGVCVYETASGSMSHYGASLSFLLQDMAFIHSRQIWDFRITSGIAKLAEKVASTNLLLMTVLCSTGEQNLSLQFGYSAWKYSTRPIVQCKTRFPKWNLVSEMFLQVNLCSSSYVLSVNFKKIQQQS